MKSVKKSHLIIALFVSLAMIIFVIIIASSGLSQPSSPSSSQSIETTHISKELESATNRVLRYWKEKEPNANPDFNKIIEAVKGVSVYRKVSYDRAADLIILAFKTGDPDIIEFMR